MRVTGHMQYVIYFLVATPLVLGGLLWASFTTPPPAPLISSTGLNAIADEAPATAPKLAMKAFADNRKKTAGQASEKNG